LLAFAQMVIVDFAHTIRLLRERLQLLSVEHF
jgi:hypothetical protein